MNLAPVLYALGGLCMVLAWLLVVPLVLLLGDAGMSSATRDAFLFAAAASVSIGLVLRLAFRFDLERFGVGEAFATVTASWLVFTVLGSLPFLITGAIPSVLDAWFEVLSGFTTTGASILPDPSRLERPLLLWRAMTQWVGGMGIVAMSVAILPALGAGGNFLFQAEVPGPEAEKLLPRISSTAKVLWAIYAVLTAAQVALLVAVGMDPFEAVCHAFATMATGGFGTRADSFTSFSPPMQWITTLFMLLAGVNFVMHLHLARGRWDRAASNVELRVYGLVMLAGIVVFAVLVAGSAADPGGVEPLVRDAAFTTASLLTSTGFATADFGSWPVAAWGLLLLVMVCGACAGSTGGGAKVIRCVLAVKAGLREVRRLLRPKAVFIVKVGGRPVPDATVFKVTGFFILYAIALVAFTVVLMLLGHDGTTSLSAVIACLSNIGPGLGDVGPTHNYASLEPLAKVLLMFCMLLGRLEFFSVLVLFVPLAWRR